MGKGLGRRWPLVLLSLLLMGLLTACPPVPPVGGIASSRDTKPGATRSTREQADERTSGTPVAEAEDEDEEAFTPTATPTVFDTPTPGPTATATPEPLAEADPDLAAQLTDEAHALFITSDLAGAEAKAIEAIAADPSYLPAHLQLIDTYLFMPHYWQQALQAAEAAVALVPDDPSALAYLSWAQQGAHLFDEARANAERAVELDPENALAQQALADILSSVYDLDLAEAAAQTAVELDPESAAAWSSLGSIASTLEYPDEAGDAYERAVELEPDFFAWHIQLARYELDQTGDVETALEVAQPGIDLQPDHPFVLSFLVDLAVERNDWATAEENCAKLFAYNQPDTPYPDAYACMAGVKLLQEDNAGADFFQTLVEEIAPPQRRDMTVLRMRLLNDDEQCDESRALAESWLEERPYSVLAMRMIGVSYLCAEDFEQAAEYFQQALDKMPRSVADARLLANAYARDNKATQARAALNQISSFAAQNPLYYQGLFEMHLYLGQTEEAIRAAQRWQVLRPESTDAMINLALAELFDNNPAAAQNYALNALEAGASGSTLYAILGESYSRAGDFEQAEKYLQQALAIYSDHFLARSFLAQLYLLNGECDKADPHVEWLIQESDDDSASADQYKRYLEACRANAARAAATLANALDDDAAISEAKATLRANGVLIHEVEFTEAQSRRNLFVVFNANMAKESQAFADLEHTIALELSKLLPRISSRPDGLLILSGSNDEPQTIFFIATQAANQWADGLLSDAEFEETWLKESAEGLLEEGEPFLEEDPMQSTVRTWLIPNA
jgi:tetratricopeptide (TPR) repeat protein